MTRIHSTKATIAAVATVAALLATPILGISPASADAGPPPGSAIPENLYSIAGFDNESPAYPAPPSLDGTAKGAIDSDVSTEWTSLNTPAPHWLSVDLGASYTVTGIQYSVKKQGNGPIKDYKVFATNDPAVAGSPTGDWGAAVATGTFTQPASNAAQQPVTFSAPVKARYIKLEGDSTINGANFVAISEIQAFTSDDVPPAGAAIPAAGYTVAGADSQATGGAAKNAFDGDTGTAWTSNNSALPHWLAVDLGASYPVTGVQYSAKKQTDGPIKDYKVFATNNAAIAQSATGDWGTAVTTGTFMQPASDAAVQSVSFAKPVTARYIKLEADTTISGANTASVSEFRAYANGPAITPPPYSVNVKSKGPWDNPDDTSASPFIDKDGKFYYESAHSLYGASDSRTWTFFTGNTMDDATASDTINNAVNPNDPTDKNNDTTARCNNSPTGKTATKAPAGSGYAQPNYCDLTQMWVDPDTGNWYGLVHNEFTPQPFGDGLHYDAIDYAVSTDQGKTWTIKSQVVTTPYSTVRGDTATFPQSTFDYGDGDPRLFADTASGYFYMYYGSRIVNKGGSWAAFYEHVARAPISGKMAPGTWSKWYNGTWSQPGLGGKESNVVPVDASNANGYTPVEKEYNPNNPGSVASQVAAGTMPATSPLFVMDITYNAYLGLYIGEPQVPDQSGNAPQQYYATKDLATQKWTLLGDTGSYTTASWYRWFLDPANATNSNIVGKDFRSYCSFGCSNGSSSEYVNVSIEPNNTVPASVIDTSKNYSIASGANRTLAQANGSTATTLTDGATYSDAAAWTFASNGDGSYTIANVGTGDLLGVGNTTAGRAWAAPLQVTPAATPSQAAQQWFVIPGATEAGVATGDFKLVNRYSGQVIALTAGADHGQTAPVRSWDATTATPAAKVLAAAATVASGDGGSAKAQTLALKEAVAVEPTETATATPTDTASPTASATATDSPTATETPTATDSPTATATATDSPTATETPTATDSPTATGTGTASPTASASAMPTGTATSPATSKPAVSSSTQSSSSAAAVVPTAADNTPGNDLAYTGAPVMLPIGGAALALIALGGVMLRRRKAAASHS
ncbi:discoidin domain-containing protein [Arthrobacter sp. ERGS1:01]|uniref:discoidin domain-containing protein n=1 Tax=Arthrobacter sp. ERGS1:01 TaxID=1704044 RepID=UPI0006B45FE4|nr:discoidin domain-containing protein [Arthrobacter sp. ERGS1:01]